jgi:hypothetical protein
MALRPWARGPFELLVHAEGHLRVGDDFDRRIALISFDNGIEVSISTYLSLNPFLRGNRQYARVDVDRWLNNYHSKLDFLDVELQHRGAAWLVDRAEIIWAHDHRNEQYHGGTKGTPERRVLSVVRDASLWIFGFLFGVPDVPTELEASLAAASPLPPARDPRIDRCIDDHLGVIHIGGQDYYASELLFGVDPVVYRELGESLARQDEQP